MKILIPLKTNLIRKVIVSDGVYVFYRKHEETAVHIFWECKITKSLWDSVTNLNLWHFPFDRRTWTIGDYWMWILENASVEDHNHQSVV